MKINHPILLIITLICQWVHSTPIDKVLSDRVSSGMQFQLKDKTLEAVADASQEVGKRVAQAATKAAIGSVLKGRMNAKDSKFHNV